MTAPARHRSLRLLAVTAVATAAAVTSVPLPAGAAPAAAPGPDVVLEWNAVALRTVYAEAGTPVPAGPVYLALVHLAVADAVAAVERRWAPYLPATGPHARGVASAEVAAATAARDVLLHYFARASAAALAADYERTVGADLEGPAGRLGQRIGAAAAQRVLATRDDTELSGPAPAFPLEPGVWRSTATPPAPMVVPWLAHVTPLVVAGSSVVDLPGPDPLTSAEYAADFAEVKAYGAAVSAVRTPEQEATGLFFTDNPIAMYNRALRVEVVEHGLDLADAARAFALLNTSIADTLIACWAEKLEHPFWRPVTAIRQADSDDNPMTEADTQWSSLVPAPQYPEYSSGHACVTGASTGALAALFGADEQVLLTHGTTGATRTYGLAELDAAAADSRIWIGIHFRRAVVDGNLLGHAVADVVTSRLLTPLPGRR